MFLPKFLQKIRRKVFMKKIILLGVIIFILAACGREDAPDVVGTSRLINIFDAVGGDARISRDGSEFSAMRGQNLFAGYSAITGEMSNIYLNLNRESVLKMDETSRVEVNQLTERSLSLTLSEGAISANITRESDDDLFEISAGGVTLGIRGTRFIVEYRTAMPIFIMLEGSGYVDGVLLTAGNMAVIENGNIVVRPFVADDSMSAFILREIGFTPSEPLAEAPVAEREASVAERQVLRYEGAATMRDGTDVIIQITLEEGRREGTTSIWIGWIGEGNYHHYTTAHQVDVDFATMDSMTETFATFNQSFYHPQDGDIPTMESTTISVTPYTITYTLDDRTFTLNRVGSPEEVSHMRTESEEMIFHFANTEGEVPAGTLIYLSPIPNGGVSYSVVEFIENPFYNAMFRTDGSQDVPFSQNMSLSFYRVDLRNALGDGTPLIADGRINITVAGYTLTYNVTFTNGEGFTETLSRISSEEVTRLYANF
jgi:hypothetical protein